MASFLTLTSEAPLIDILETAARSLGLPEEAAKAFVDAAGPVRRLRAGERLAAQGEPSAGLYVILAGVTKSCRLLETGQTQTLALFTEGEVCGLQGAALGSQPATLAAVSAARLRLIPATALKRLMREHPGLSEGLWRATAREAMILQEWMVGMGRRPALAQIAHLLCEIAMRMRLAGRAVGDVFDFPLTQTELADAVGLSSVHVNCVLQTLRGEGLVNLTRGELRIGDWPRLERTAGFDADYLGLPPDPGVQHASVLFSPGHPHGVGSR